MNGGVLVGFPGEIARAADRLVEPARISAESRFGFPLKIVNGVWGPIVAGDGVSVVKGFLVREGRIRLPGEENLTCDTGSMNGVLRRGYMYVRCPLGEPVRGAAVHMRTVADGTHPVGELSAVAVTGETALLPNVEWAVNGKGENDIAEMRVVT